MKTYVLGALVGFMLVTPSLVAQTNVATPTRIPEEARKHFVMGTTLFKDAKTADDFVQVESEFKQAADLAPQWPEARYNLALAREAAGDYSGAMADLKVYQQFKLSDADARNVQDKIYALEAKQQKKDGAAKVAADAASAKEAAATQAENVYKGLDSGVWKDVGYDYNSHHYPAIATTTHLQSFIEIHDHQFEMYQIDDLNGRMRSANATFNSRHFHVSLKGSDTGIDVTISEDGKSIFSDALYPTANGVPTPVRHYYDRIK